MVVTAPPDDYDDDAERIDEEYIPDNATTDAEISQALDDAGFPQAAQSDIQDWLTSESEAWDVVDENTFESDQIEREIQRQSNGTVSDSRAQSMADNISSEINDAREKAISQIASDGTVRREDGAQIGEINNLSEEIRDDGVYFRNENTGTETRVAEFDRGGR